MKFQKHFKTDSSYEGEWNRLDMNGYGKYTFPHGVVYEGNMEDGFFHGEGKLTYPRGQVINGKFHKGKMISWQFTFRHGDSCVLDQYCKFPDRRFGETIRGDFLPPGRERITPSQPTRVIPEGHYDVGDGFFDPETKWIYAAGSFPSKGGPVLSRMPLPIVKPIEVNIYLPDGVSFVKKIPFVPVYQDEKFIIDHCRKAWDEPSGYRPDLYEKWMSGRQKECERYRKKLAASKDKDGDRSNCLKLLEFLECLAMKEKSKSESRTRVPY
ncbi:hypothetical protein HHI36_016773 [Cryptolaemus montrouzieri]|uniref:MORN repeat-containing protein 5 n=1 Tax=Cryptolaemus montrouzieri TaxID=559131 RepID=A0ABD2NKM2_9CUCU